jgi:hypothetical protein
MSSFITTDATQSVFDLVMARPVITAAGEHPWLVHLWWSAPLQGARLVQVYVQDELYDVTLDPTLREMMLVLDRTRTNRIELLAVPDDDVEVLWRPQPDLLGCWQPGVMDAVEVAMVRDEALGVETQVVVEVDGQAVDSGAVWPNDENRSDPGGQLEEADVSGLGLGVGALGVGRLGFDGTAWRWRRDDLAVGSHDIEVKAQDLAGQSAATSILLQGVQIDNLPDPVAGLSIDDSFVLSWS